MKRSTEPVALSSVASTDRPRWALRPSKSSLWKRPRLTRAPCSVSNCTLLALGIPRWCRRGEKPATYSENRPPAFYCFFFQAEDGIRDDLVTGVQTCALPI